MKEYNKKKVNNNKRYNVFDIVFYKETPDDIKDEIIEVLKTTQFNKISIPVSSYKKLVNHDQPDDTKNLTVGFIKSFNKNNNKLKVVVFNNFKERINKLDNSAIEVIYTEKTNKSGNVSLGTIIKFNIINIEK